MNETHPTAAHPFSSGFLIGLVLFICLCIIVGIIGNVGVISYNIFMNHSKTPTTYFVINLAISDIIVCVTFFPPWLVQKISLLVDGDTDAVLVCKIGKISSTTSVALSIVNLLAITFDRYIFISKPLKYTRIMTWNRIYILLVAIWLFSIVNINLVLFSTKEVADKRIICQIKNPGKNIFAFINIYIPVVCILYLNYKIYQVARNQRKKIRHGGINNSSQCIGETAGVSETTVRKRRLQQIKVVKTFAIVLGVFLCCTMPTFVISFINFEICKRMCVPTSITWFAGTFVGANSAMNPFIYSSRNKEYRIAYHQFCARLCRNN